MDEPLFDTSARRQMKSGESLLYHPGRNWFQIFGPIFSIVFALLLVAAFLVLSFWLNELNKVVDLTWIIKPQNSYLSQFIEILRWIVLVFGVVILLDGILQLITFMGINIVLTDQRIMGRTGRSMLRKVNIPLDSIAWIDFPNNIFSKGPIRIHTKDGRKTTLWSLAKPEVFLGFIERQYPRELMPVINKPLAVATMVRVVVGIIVIGTGICYLLSLFLPGGKMAAAIQPTLKPSLIPATPAPEFTRTAIPSPTKRPTSTPMPITEVDFTSFQTMQMSDKVTITGQLQLPSSLYCDYKCGVFLRDPANYAEKIHVFIFVPAKENTPSPNMMARLEENYQEKDFQVRLDNGEYVGNYAMVHITGSVCETTSGALAICDIIKIESASP